MLAATSPATRRVRIAVGFLAEVAEQHAGQVFALGMAEQHRMVGAGTKTLEQAHPASRAALSNAHRANEILAAKVRRATEGHQEAARIERTERERVEFDVQVLGAPCVTAAARKWWRVEHYQVETLLAPAQQLARLAMREANGVGRIAIELQVAPRPLERLRGSVHGDDFFGAALERVEREAPGVAAQIEHAGAVRQSAEARAIFALVEKGTGLLAVLQIDD